MNKWHLLIATLIFSFITGVAQAAGTCNGCLIKDMGSGPYYDNRCTSNACVFIAISPMPTGSPACATNAYWHFALDVSTAGGRATYASLMNAQVTNRRINIAGSNDCSLNQGPIAPVENFHYMHFAP